MPHRLNEREPTHGAPMEEAGLVGASVRVVQQRADVALVGQTPRPTCSGSRARHTGRKRGWM